MAKKNQKSQATTRHRNKEPLLAPDADYIDYKNVVELRRFISDRGKIRSRSVTGRTLRQQRMVAAAIKNAREMALLPYSGAHSAKDTKR